jgi:carbon monoxide dehydrogenase subunit G
VTRSIQFSNQLSIRRDLEDVFAFVADFSQVPTWNYAIRSTQQVTPGPVALGSTFRQVRTIPAVAEEEFEVTAWEPDRRVAITGDFGPFSGTLTYQVEPAPAGTLLTNDVELSPRGVLGVVGRIAGPRVKAAIAQNLEVLRSGLESG